MIELPGNVFENITNERTGVVFSYYSTSSLFPLRIEQDISENSTYKAIGSSVISAIVAGQNETRNLRQPVVVYLDISIMVSSCVLYMQYILCTYVHT